MRRTLPSLACLLLVACELTLSIARAQGLPDAQPPVIEIETLDLADAGERQVFTAQVVDDRELLDVTLYHRRAGRQAFTPEPMRALGGSSFYSATLVTDAEDLRTIEYYVQARDEGGNRTVSGFAFDPYSRELRAATALATAPVDSAPAAPDAPPNNATGTVPSPSIDADAGGLRWWHVALGAVAVGALAAAAGGSGGSDGDGRVPLTINLAEPQ